MFFKKKKYSMPTAKIRALDRRGLKYVIRRNADYTETRLGDEGAVNIAGGELVLVCGGKNVFRCNLGEVEVSELMNLSGITLRGTDKDTGSYLSVTAYFSDGVVRVK